MSTDSNTYTLSYSRKGPSREVLPSSLPERNDRAEVSQPDLKTLTAPAGYSRREASVSPCIICVISGGTTRERKLFRYLENQQRFKRLSVVFFSSNTAPLPNGGLTPFMMRDQFDKICHDNKIILNNRTISLHSIDRIYLVSDVDHYYDQLAHIFSHADPQNRLRWIISNPCIETWIYYCFRNDPQTDLADIHSVTPSQRSSWLKNRNGQFNNGGGLDPRKTFHNLKPGITNSLSNYAVDQAGIPTLLSTDMHILAQDIIDTLGEEYIFT